jgi:hypothetical protein
MDDLRWRVAAWTKPSAVLDAELDRVNFLRNPLGPINDPKIFRPVRVKVLKGFYAGGVARKAGEIVSVPFCLAEDVCARGRAEWVT